MWLWPSVPQTSFLCADNAQNRSFDCAGIHIRRKGKVSMEIGLKILHYFAILFAGGIAVGSGVMQSAYARAGEVPPPHAGKAFALLGYIGLGSIVTLWITGIGLAHLIYGGLGINGAFHVKLLGATLVLGVSVTANLHARAAMKAKRPPNAVLMKRLLQLGRGGIAIAICAAAVAFTN
jgi:hypothetical protein